MNKNYRIICAEEPKSLIAEAYRKLALNLKYVMLDKNCKVIALTSARESEGKTSCTMNLAVTLASLKQKVCVVDLDVRMPKQHIGFELDIKTGITDYILEDKKITDIIKHSKYGVDVLTRGEKVEYSSLVIESYKTDEIIEALRAEYDYVLLDCPPVLLLSDTLSISRFTDGFIFVIDYKNSKRSDVKLALKELKQVNANIIGTVATKVTSPRNKNYYYYGGKDGK